MADVSQACGVLLAFGRSSKDVREQAWSCGGRIARTTSVYSTILVMHITSRVGAGGSGLDRVSPQAFHFPFCSHCK